MNPIYQQIDWHFYALLYFISLDSLFSKIEFAETSIPFSHHENMSELLEYPVIPTAFQVEPTEFPDLDWLYNLEVTKIFVAHRHRDHTKWGLGMVVSEWLLTENLPGIGENVAGIIEEEVFEKAQYVGKDVDLLEEIKWSWVYYNHPEWMPSHHKYGTCTHLKFDVIIGDVIYTIELKFFAWLLGKQNKLDQVERRKGSICISYKYRDETSPVLRGGVRIPRWQPIWWSAH
jgi:hypothetical protein